MNLGSSGFFCGLHSLAGRSSDAAQVVISWEISVQECGPSFSIANTIALFAEITLTCIDYEKMSNVPQIS
jgi:hypothetical protein